MPRELCHQPPHTPWPQLQMPGHTAATALPPTQCVKVLQIKDGESVPMSRLKSIRVPLETGSKMRIIIIIP